MFCRERGLGELPIYPALERGRALHLLKVTPFCWSPFWTRRRTPAWKMWWLDRWNPPVPSTYEDNSHIDAEIWLTQYLDRLLPNSKRALWFFGRKEMYISHFFHLVRLSTLQLSFPVICVALLCEGLSQVLPTGVVVVVVVVEWWFVCVNDHCIFRFIVGCCRSRRHFYFGARLIKFTQPTWLRWIKNNAEPKIRTFTGAINANYS